MIVHVTHFKIALYIYHHRVILTCDTLPLPFWLVSGSHVLITQIYGVELVMGLPHVNITTPGEEFFPHQDSCLLQDERREKSEIEKIYLFELVNNPRGAAVIVNTLRSATECFVLSCFK